MRIISWHGYLLRGSGSNIYNSNTAQQWRASGHDVLLMCQERDTAGLPFVDAAFDLDPNDRSLPGDLAGGAGSCVVARPDIAGLLPVYVYDRYPGFEVKTFIDLTDAELTRYVELNVSALTTAIRSFDPDVIFVGHEVMGPYIAKVACSETATRFTAKLHGSALEYAVKKQVRYLDSARVGLDAADVVVGGSSYMVQEAHRVIGGRDWDTVVVNPGCDLELFKPRDKEPSVRLGFVGKLIYQKGVHNLLLALGLTHVPGLSLDIVGYGGDAALLQGLASALADRDVDGVDRALEMLSVNDQTLDHPGLGSRYNEVPVSFLGRLEHDRLSGVLPGWDAIVVPSVLPEAFGMVAAEAAACGVLPIVPDHSGIGEVGRALEHELGRPGLLVYDPAKPIEGIAQRIDDILGLPARERTEFARIVAVTARARWSWKTTAERLLDAALTRPASGR